MIADRLFRPRNFGLTTPDNPLRFWKWLPIPQLPAGIPVTADTALQLSAVWACVRVIAQALAQSPWQVFEVDPDTKKRNDRPDDALYYLLNVRPNPDMTAFNWREGLAFAFLTWGNAYCEIVRDGANRPTELWPLVPERMIVKRRDQSHRMFYEYHQTDGDMVELEPEDVLHFRGTSISGLMGENIVARSAKAIALSMAEERFALSYFGNNTVVGSVLKLPPGKTLPPGRYKELQEDWQEKRQGPDKAHKPLILEDGMDFQQITADADRTQLTEARRFQLEEICFVPGTEILTQTGPKAIETIQAGELVLTHRGRWRRVNRTMQRPYVGEVVTAHAKGLSPVTATSNHPFYVQTAKPSRTHKISAAGAPQWVAAGELQATRRQSDGARARGAFQNLVMPRMVVDERQPVDLAVWAQPGAVHDADEIRASKNHRATPVKRTPQAGYDLGWLCGLFAADGSTGHHQTVFYLGAHEKDLSAVLRSRLSSVFGAQSRTRTVQSVDQTVVSNRVLSDFFSQFGHQSHEKAFPGWCMSQSQEFRDGLLDGVVAGDGCSARGYTMLRTTSTALAWQVRLLLWSRGQHASLVTAAESTWTINGRSGVSREIHTVQWRTTRERRGSMGLTDDGAYFSLDSVERSTYAGTVHNLEVDEDESYTTVGGVVHNCRWYGVPLHMVQSIQGSSGHTGANIEAMGIEFVRNGVTPHARRCEQEVDYKLLAGRGPKRQTIINLGGLMHGDAKTRAEARMIMRQGGAINANEWRESEGMNDIGPEGDLYTVPMNWTTLEGMQKSVDEIGKEPPQPAAKPSGGEKGKGGKGDGGGTGELAPSKETENVARQAIAALVAGALERHRRRMANRAADLARLPEDRVATLLDEERERQVERLADDFAEPMAMWARLTGGTWTGADATVGALARSVEQGEPPHLAAERFLSGCLPSNVAQLRRSTR